MRTLAVLLLAGITLSAAAPVPVIFDTDMGNDVDDVLALALLHSLETRGEAKVLEVPVQASEAIEVGSVTQRAFDAAAELVVNVFRSAAKRL